MSAGNPQETRDICHSCSEIDHQGSMWRNHVKYEMAPYLQILRTNPRLPTKKKKEKRNTVEVPTFLIRIITKLVTFVRPGDQSTESQASPLFFLGQRSPQRILQNHDKAPPFIYNSSLLMSLKFDANSVKNLPAPTCNRNRRLTR